MVQELKNGGRRLAFFCEGQEWLRRFCVTAVHGCTANVGWWLSSRWVERAQVASLVAFVQGVTHLPFQTQKVPQAQYFPIQDAQRKRFIYDIQLLLDASNLQLKKEIRDLTGGGRSSRFSANRQGVAKRASS